MNLVSNLGYHITRNFLGDVDSIVRLGGYDRLNM